MDADFEFIVHTNGGRVNQKCKNSVPKLTENITVYIINSDFVPESAQGVAGIALGQREVIVRIFRILQRMLYVLTDI